MASWQTSTRASSSQLLGEEKKHLPFCENCRETWSGSHCTYKDWHGVDLWSEGEKSDFWLTISWFPDIYARAWCYYQPLYKGRQTGFLKAPGHYHDGQQCGCPPTLHIRQLPIYILMASCTGEQSNDCSYTGANIAPMHKASQKEIHLRKYGPKIMQNASKWVLAMYIGIISEVITLSCLPTQPGVTAQKLRLTALSVNTPGYDLCSWEKGIAPFLLPLLLG